MPRKVLSLLILICLVPTLFAQTAAPVAGLPIFGFSHETAVRQVALEARFDGFLRSSNLNDWMKRLTARPHHLGSAYNKENADFIAAQFKSWGYETKLEEFHVLFPTPKTRIVEMTAPERFTMKLQEPRVEGDATSGQLDEQLPPYNAYSIDGDVTGPLVYVNYGIPAITKNLIAAGSTSKERS